jgi:putative copper resistance protein D
MTSARALAGAAVVVAAASALAWALAYPYGSLSATLVRAVADCAAVTAAGLAVVPTLDDSRYRSELIGRAFRPLALAGAVWLVAELTRLIMLTTQAASTSVRRLGVGTTIEFAVHTAPGRAVVLSAAAAAVVCVTAMVAPRSVPVGIAVAGIAAVGIAARLVTGHFAESTLSGLAVAAHTLAAVLWCGALVGLVLTVTHRGQWARVLPRFSQLALYCIVVLLIGGIAGAAAKLGSPSALFATGYGRVLAAKVVMTIALMVLGWRNRTIWLPAARSHTVTATVSRTRSLVELSAMAVALTLAAGLAVTG